MLLRDKLREATGRAHEALEARLALTDPRLGFARYVSYLECLLAFYRVLEPALFEAGRMWPPLRACGSKVAWLQDDLRYFGKEPAIPEPPRHLLPPLAGAPEAIGSGYVLEGATLGGCVLYAQLRARWGIARHRGGSFLFGYGARTAANWKAFVGALNTTVLDEQEEARCLEAARQTFAGLDAWFAHNHWPMREPAGAR